MPVTPMGALGRGLAAGTAASIAMDRFMAHSMKALPDLGQPRFEPPEPAQRDETPTQTTARRIYEGLLQRGPLSPKAKARGGILVHYAFGAGWAALYGLARESFPWARGPLASVGFGTLVWGAGDYGIVPAFRLGASMWRTPPKLIALTWAAHAVFGLATWAAYESSRPRTWATTAATLFAYQLDRKARRALPEKLWQPGVRKVARRAAKRAALLGLQGSRVSRAVTEALQ